MLPSRKTDWPTLSLLAAMYAALVGNFALYWSSPLPLALHILVSTAAIHLAFTVWHEAVHRSISKIGWMNDAAGILGVFPYMAPFYVEKWFHLQHHALLNQRDDPNFLYMDGPFWQMPFRYVRILRYARRRMRDDPRSRRQKVADALSLLVVACLYGAALWRGAFLDVVLLWFVPVVASKLIMDWYINYLPHVGLPPERFRGTRIVDIPWLTVALLGHNYHAIHHLWPSIPWHRYRATFEQKRDYLREHGVPIETRISAARIDAAKIAGPDSLSG
jgi:ring-1,2-phenylacetyl-CoA epoxidase subunit PaaE